MYDYQHADREETDAALARLNAVLADLAQASHSDNPEVRHAALEASDGSGFRRETDALRALFTRPRR